ATQRASFPQPHEGGSGPIIFNGPSTLFYGESVWAGNGYFHLVDSTEGAMAHEDYLVFEGGLASAAFGYNQVIYATAGGGKGIYQIQGAVKTLVGTSDDDAQGLAYDGMSLYVSTQVPYSGGDDDGAISFHELWNPDEAVQVVPAPPYRARYLGEPDPAAFAWNSTLAYYDHQLIHAGDDNRIYAYHLVTGGYEEVLDLSENPDFGFGPSGFLVSHDHYLYFNNNGNSDKIYRIDLTASAPAIESFESGASGSIFAFTQNPWTDVIWFNSADFGEGSMYLYEVNAAFDAATQRASFVKPHGADAGTGPILFKNEDTLLYGESVWGGNGYFHVMDVGTGEITDTDYLVFEGGLAGVVHGYDNTIYATTGAGKSAFEIEGTTKTEVAATFHDAQGLAFDGHSLYVSTQTPTGVIGGLALWRVTPTGVPPGQEVPEGTVGGDLAVKALGVTGDKAVGVSPGDPHTFVEYLESIDPEDVSDQINRPARLPFGLVQFRLRAASQDGAATAAVHFSEPAPTGSKWYRYDPIQGWYDYSEHATFSEDRTSVTLEFADGGNGDADRMVNGYILEPGGVGLPKAKSGGGGSSCFIDTAGSPALWHPWTVWPWLLFWAPLLGACVSARMP
ncbi:MAG: choice-of-anchor U domain-containing protein, partial [Thermodesulfobacteriota bacterium]|nr:choice-of-anchor U domain-containing protein [Thermodesulfobacteriota bacterium]